MKQDLALMNHHRAPFRNLNFVKPQILLVLNFSVSKSFLVYHDNLLQNSTDIITK